MSTKYEEKEEDYTFEFEVTATPAGRNPKKFEFPVTASSSEITGSTVPIVFGEKSETEIETAIKLIEIMKNNIPEGSEMTIEEETTMRKSHRTFPQFQLGMTLDKGFWGISFKPMISKEIRTKTTKIKVKKSSPNERG